MSLPKIKGHYKTIIPGMPDIPQYDLPITPRENFYRYINHGDYLWHPDDMDTITVNPRIIPDLVARAMISDGLPFDKLTEAGGKDMFGVEWQYVEKVDGSMVKPGNPLLEEACEWEEKVVFPDVSAMDWEACAQRNQFLLSQGKLIKMPFYTGFFERLVSFMDMEGALIALVDEEQQEDVKALFDRLADFYIEMIINMRKYFHLDILWFHDDWGSQKAPLFSYGTVEEMILPYLKKVIGAAHEAGVIFGCIESLVPLIIEAGADMWDGQNMNDKQTLSRTYRGKLGLEVEAPIRPGMSDQELHACIREMLDQYAPGVFLSKTFRSDPRLSPIAYEESRIRYSQ